MKKINIDYFRSLLFCFYLPVTFILWVFLVMDKPFFIGAISLLSVSCFLFLSMYFKKIKIDINMFYFLFFLMYCFCVVLINLIYGDLVDSYGRSLSFYHFNLLYLYFISYFVGRNFLFIVNKTTTFFLMLSFVMTIYITDFSKLSINADIIDSEKFGVYLALADMMAIILFFVMSFFNGELKKFLFFLFGVFLLFILNSRASLYSYIIVFSVYFVFYFKSSRNIYIYVCMIFLIIFSIFYFDFSSLMNKNSRMLAVFSGMDLEPSKIGRDKLFYTGVERILLNPIFGDYGGVIKIYNNIGSYMHNMLSYWQTFGVLPFFIVFYFFIVQPFIVIFKSLKYKKCFDTGVYFTVSLYVVIMVVLSKSYTWVYAWFLLGFLHNFKYEHFGRLVANGFLKKSKSDDKSLNISSVNLNGSID